MQHFVSLTAVLLCGLSVVSGCRTAAQRPHVRSEVHTDEPTQGRPTLGMPITVAGQDLVIIPFTMDRAMTWVEDNFGHAQEYGIDLDLAYRSFESAATDGLPDGGNRWRPITVAGNASRVGNTLPAAPLQPRSLDARRNVRWHNAVLKHPGAGTSQLLLGRRGVITQLILLGEITFDEENVPETTVKAVLFNTVIEDTGGDGKLSGRDAHTLYAGDGAAGGLHAINPPGTQVDRMRYDHTTNTLYLLLIADTNADQRFTQADTAQPYTYVLGEAGLAQAMVDPGLIEQAEALLR